MKCSNQHISQPESRTLGVCVPSVCFLSNRIHHAAPSYKYPAKYWLFWAHRCSLVWWPTQLWEAWVELLMFPCTWLGPVAGALNFHLQHEIATWVGPRFQGTMHPNPVPQISFQLVKAGPWGVALRCRPIKEWNLAPSVLCWTRIQ